MDGLVSVDAVYVALIFIVPGYIFSSVRSQFVVGRTFEGSGYFVRLLTISCVNFALYGWTIYLAIAHSADANVRAALWVFVILIAPAVTGAIAGICIKRDWIRKIYQRYGINPLHHIPSAWDFKFSTSPGEFVLVTLTDGSSVAGHWSSASFASTDMTERDIYIEKIYDQPDDQSASWIPTNKSALVLATHIQMIEFFANSEVTSA
ncbi:DUF6338 family protein [Mesorhizobium sp.]|uniref:DUF6338 family protein n=1 Tax=Mesorhizobium sp. TaxID=1871066 RepID=UPI0011F5C395|nr:DUF6338 family protein [Mesorhizobium sp.]TIN10399.1 MAG: hypothetical protein E5Y14_11090 [Mesorhizobium sp.]